MLVGVRLGSGTTDKVGRAWVGAWVGLDLGVGGLDGDAGEVVGVVSCELGIIFT